MCKRMKGVGKSVEKSSLKVAVNATPLLSPMTGIGRYLYSLCEQLELMQHVSCAYFYGVRWATDLSAAELPQAANRIVRLATKAIPGSRSLLRGLQQHRFSRGVQIVQPDVYHEPAFTPFRFDGPTVLTVHDVSWVHFPNAHPPERVRYLERVVSKRIGEADQVITDSEYVRSEVVRIFGVDPNRVSAIHLASDPVFRPRTAHETRTVLSPLRLEHGRYWLSVGTLEPRKNLEVMLDAFCQLTPAERRACPLVIVGALGWGYQGLLHRIEAMMETGEVHYLGYLHRLTQAILVSGARALIYPSIYEGFGLPLVESMQSGTPVIASDASCLPEVLGGAGCVFQPRDVDALRDHLKRLLLDDALLESLRAQGLVRSQAFSWSRCAQDTFDVYRRAVGRDSGR